MSFEWENLLRLFLALVFGGIIGYERESAHRPAGLRTNILVCLGAALIMLLESYYHDNHPGATDHLRMAAQVVTGIGFLGAGTIVQTRSAIKGLTTAATIWVTAAIGMSLGVGFYYAATITMLFVLVSLRGLKILEKALAVKSGRILIISGESKGNFSKKLTEAANEMNINIWDLRVSVTKELSIEASLRIPAHVDIDHIVERLMKIEGVHRVTTELILE